MKVLIPFLLSFLSFSTLANVYQLIDTRSTNDVTVNENGSDVTVSFHVARLETNSTRTAPLKGFEALKFNSLKVSTIAGKPALPYHSIIVKGVPADYTVSVDLGEAKNIDGVVPAPAEPQKFRCLDCAPKSAAIDWTSYDVDNDVVTKEYLGDFRGTSLTKVTFFPAVYGKQGLRVYPKANFTIKSNVRGKLDSMVMPSDIITEASLNNKYLIIAPAEFVDVMQTFVDWKMERGYDVEMITLESVGRTADEILRFVHAKYAQEPFTYALFVGHEKSFPTFYKSTSSSYRTPTDLPYFTFGGPNDFVPDVFNGRFVVGTVAELERIIAKTIEFEKGEYADASGLKRTIGMASNEGSNPSDVDYVYAMLEALEGEFGLESKYFLQRNYDSTPANVNAELSAGVVWLNYIGHGSGYSWPSQYRTYDSSDVKKIDSEGKVKPVIIDVACQNGNYTYGKKKLGVEFMIAENNGNPTGAVAYFGGSVNISWHPPAIMAVGINRAVAAHKVEHLGPALLAGQLFLTANHDGVSEIKDNYTWYMLQGDPSLHIDL